MWVRTGCLPCLSHEYDEMITNERKLHPELLTAKSNLTYHERKLAGLCPLNALDITRWCQIFSHHCYRSTLGKITSVPLKSISFCVFRLLRALGPPKNARIYWAGSEPLGGKEALLPLTREFPHFNNK